MRKPTPLRRGDTVALIAPSGPVNPEKLSDGVKILESMGLCVHIFDSCYASHEYLAGRDELRLRDLHAAFANKNIKGIFAARGGYGSARLLPYTDFTLIRDNPKIFAGYSDITALHIALNQFCKLVTFHAPMPAADLPIADEITITSFKQELFENPVSCVGFAEKSAALGGFSRSDVCERMVFGHSPSPPLQKTVKGILTGGNLSVIASLIGTPYEIDTRGKILFLEETGEPPYRIDRLFLQLKLAGKFRDAAGFVLGDFSGENKKLAVSELIIPEGKPIIAEFPAGHCMPNITLPLGQTVTLPME